MKRASSLLRLRRRVAREVRRVEARSAKPVAVMGVTVMRWHEIIALAVRQINAGSELRAYLIGRNTFRADENRLRGIADPPAPAARKALAPRPSAG